MAEIYVVRWAPHVKGEIPNRESNGDGGFEVQWVKMSCAVCGDRAKWPCTTGAPRQRVLQYAKMHLHKDPLGSGKPKL